jgi:4-methyl-5(b-hydroxyethyl)-thiazole monophosphate biosynthesis
MNKKVCMLFCDGFEEIEALAVVDILRRASVEIEMLGVQSGKRVVQSANRIGVTIDRTLEEASGELFDMVILPGGSLGTANLDRSEEVHEFVMKHANAKKKLAAICAAPSVLGKYGLLRGKRATCYPSLEEKLRGAIVADASESVVVDGDIITSRGPATACAFGFKILEELGFKSESREWQAKMLFPVQG